MKKTAATIMVFLAFGYSAFATPYCGLHSIKSAKKTKNGVIYVNTQNKECKMIPDEVRSLPFELNITNGIKQSFSPAVALFLCKTPADDIKPLIIQVLEEQRTSGRYDHVPKRKDISEYIADIVTIPKQPVCPVGSKVVGPKCQEYCK